MNGASVPAKCFFRLLIFFHVEENGTKRRRPCPALSCASSNRPMMRRIVPPCGVAKLARVLTICRLLRVSLRLAPCLTARCLRHSPVYAAGARGNSPAFRRTQTVRVLLSFRIVDAWRGTKGINPLFKPLFRGLFGDGLRPSALRMKSKSCYRCFAACL